MAVRGCSLCGYQIRYHGEPEGIKPIEYVFCKLDKWRELEVENLSADYLEGEHENFFSYAWRCERCNTFMFFDHLLKSVGAYTPKDEFSSASIQEPFEFGPFWDDFLWFDITEDDINAAEVFTKYPQNLWLAKNDAEMRIYKDEARTECVAQFGRFHSPEVVTVATMSLTAFKKMLLSYDDEIDFLYQGVGYEFIKEDIGGGRIRIVVNRDFDNPQCVYGVTVSAQDDFTEDLVNAKIFPDGRSIADAASDVRL